MADDDDQSGRRRPRSWHGGSPRQQGNRSQEHVSKSVRPDHLRSDMSQGQVQEREHYVDSQPGVMITNIPSDDADVDQVIRNRPKMTLKYRVFNWDQTIAQVAGKIFATENEACKHSGYVMCYNNLGAGAYGMVFLGFWAQDMRKQVPARHAVVIKRCQVVFSEASSSERGSTMEDSAFRNLLCDRSCVIEVSCLLCFRHKNVVRMLDRFAVVSTTSVYLVLEYCDGGTLSQEIHNQPDQRMSEPVARYFFKQIMDGIAYIHSEGVVHRDLKPENILLRISGNGMTVKIADFGFSVVYRHVNEHNQPVEVMGDKRTGTIPYVPPEGLMWRFPEEQLTEELQRYSFVPLSSADGYAGYPATQPDWRDRADLKHLVNPFHLVHFQLPGVDVYAAGIILYQMLAGVTSLPYHYQSWPFGLDRVFRGEAIRNRSIISDEAFQFFQAINEPVPFKRLTVEGVLAHSWMHQEAHPPDVIEAAAFHDFRMTTAFPHFSRFQVEGKKFLGQEKERIVAGPDGKLRLRESPQPSGSRSPGTSGQAKRRASSPADAESRSRKK